ncbi:CatB-related O-acetyltransferase [Celeribacter litoreus]|uniref:CatB-related O-acetyltransferase n=1 Tax=Celeribacter litoreus TaxID=2876714 RepID=UPI001CC96720|nr:CatB-related O-acetyltransferase [Celeribacter litoreus]MCA0042397.1 CatB-related O-acetyltransferase [Celeribacter litoreus]
MPFSTPDTSFPLRLPDGSVHGGTVFLSAILEHPRIEVGDYSYASSHQPFLDGADVAARLAPYTYEFSPERLIIGKFCQIAHGAQFITSSANHRFDGLSSFPFMIFDDALPVGRPSMPDPGPDTVIGNDVWIGTGAMILPGAVIGDGVIVGAGAVVRGEIAPYTIISGNPAQQVRERLSPEDAARMQALAWWDWPIETILAHEAEICGQDIAALERIAERMRA